MLLEPPVNGALTTAPAADEHISLDIVTLQRRYIGGKLSPSDLLAQVQDRIARYADPAVWIERFSPAEIDRQLRAATERKRAGAPQPLLGIPFAIKDNIDYAGQPTTAGCPAFKYIAEKASSVVQRLCDAGAVAIGKTNLDQFATGLVGTRSPYGACRNPFDPHYMSGGSSSGSAVAVAAGLVSFALGTDTAGSGRVPAGCNNIVGLKPTRGLLSTAGVVPACRSLDCVSIFALNCDDAHTVFEIARGFDPSDAYSRDEDDLPNRHLPTSKFRFGVPRDRDLQFFGNREMESLFCDSIRRLESLGGECAEFDYEPFAKAASLLYQGPWVAERYLTARALLRERPEAILPVIRAILSRAPSMSAADAFAATYELESLKQLARREWRKMDAMLLPTAGTIYTIAEIEANPIVLNTNLGYYTNFVNLLDLCAVAVPAGFQASKGLPAGVSLIAPAGLDRTLLELGSALHRALGIGPGVAKQPILQVDAATKKTMSAPTHTTIAVVGAHLSRMPLNHQLTELGGVLVRAARTAPTYRLYALPGTTPPKPGLIRANDGQPGASIELEIWDLSHESFGRFVAAIPSPLGIGTIRLEDGTAVQGFLCEPFAIKGAKDISEFGGWRAYIKSLGSN
jgi:allophanate hydrolase